MLVFILKHSLPTKQKQNISCSIEFSLSINTLNIKTNTYFLFTNHLQKEVGTVFFKNIYYVNTQHITVCVSEVFSVRKGFVEDFCARFECVL